MSDAHRKAEKYQERIDKSFWAKDMSEERIRVARIKFIESMTITSNEYDKWLKLKDLYLE